VTCFLHVAVDQQDSSAIGSEPIPRRRAPFDRECRARQLGADQPNEAFSRQAIVTEDRNTSLRHFEDLLGAVASVLHGNSLLIEVARDFDAL
jgi:hypothetical protein